MGTAISLDSTGLVLAVGAPENDGSFTDAGHTRVYDWDGSDWVQRGLDIDGEDSYDKSGFAVGLSADGDVVVIGSPNSNSTGVDAGMVRVYFWTGANWVQRGADIDGEAANDFLVMLLISLLMELP